MGEDQDGRVKRPKIDPELASSSSAPTADVVKVLHILHFNDVYHVESRVREPVGGAARFKVAVDSFAEKSPLVLFSGDAFNPSLTSTITKGKHMVPVLNELGISAAVFGNHDFDFGVPHLEKLARFCNFPWLFSNVIDTSIGEPFASGKRSIVLEHQGLKIGLVGLVEREWIDTMATVPATLHYIDFVEEGQRLVDELHRVHGVDAVIALTHMREANDLTLAEQVTGIDVILGGHDHFYAVKHVGKVSVIKSGCDFRQLSHVELRIIHSASGERRTDITVSQVDVTSAFAENPKIKGMINELGIDEKKLNKVVANTETVLDVTVEAVRTRESNFASYTCDVLRDHFKADVTLLCGGGFRSDDVYGPGPFTLGDLMNILPFEDPAVVISMKGRQLLASLENGVSLYPRHEGRFPQVSGLKFVFDPKKKAGSRVVSVTIANTPIDLDKDYSVCTRLYMAEGRDGYDAMRGCPYIIEEEHGKLFSQVMRLHFMQLKMARIFAHKTEVVHLAIDNLKRRAHIHTPPEIRHHYLNVAPVADGRIVMVEESGSAPLPSSAPVVFKPMLPFN